LRSLSAQSRWDNPSCPARRARAKAATKVGVLASKFKGAVAAPRVSKPAAEAVKPAAVLACKLKAAAALRVSKRAAAALRAFKRAAVALACRAAAERG